MASSGWPSSLKSENPTLAGIPWRGGLVPPGDPGGAARVGCALAAGPRAVPATPATTARTATSDEALRTSSSRESEPPNQGCPQQWPKGKYLLAETRAGRSWRAVAFSFDPFEPHVYREQRRARHVLLGTHSYRC